MFQYQHFIIGYLSISFNLLGTLVIIISSVFEYYRIFLKDQDDETKFKREKKFIIISICLALCLCIITIVLVAVFLKMNVVLAFQIIMTLIITLVTVLVLRVYLKEKTITRLFLFFVFFSSVLMGTTAIIGYLDVEWAWALSYVFNFVFITLIMTTGLAAPIEKRITDSEEHLRQLSEDLEQKVEDRTQELKIMNEELEAFSYSVSHDLRTPLRSITGFSNAILEDFSNQLDATGKDYLVRISNSSKRMNQIIDDLLEFSKLSQTELKKEVVDLSSLASIVIVEHQRINPNPQVEFVIEDGLFALSDPVLLRLVLENLISNALKYSSNKPTPKIEFGSQKKDDKMIFFVKDNGVGFDMKYKDKLFEVFQRLHSSTEFSGSGIGLATIKRIIQRHGGEVWAEGEVDKGATFYFTLAKKTKL